MGRGQRLRAALRHRLVGAQATRSGAGTSYGQALEAGEFGLNFDESDGGLTFTYHGLKLPLTPTSYAQVLTRAQGADFGEWARRFAVATPETSAELKTELATAAQDASVREH